MSLIHPTTDTIRHTDTIVAQYLQLYEGAVATILHLTQERFRTHDELSTKRVERRVSSDMQEHA
jgi:hypothetical protein